jgi:hypothetical protein
MDLVVGACTTGVKPTKKFRHRNSHNDNEEEQFPSVDHNTEIRRKLRVLPFSSNKATTIAIATMAIYAAQRWNGSMASRSYMISAVLALVMTQRDFCSAFLAPNIARHARQHVGVTTEALAPTWQQQQYQQQQKTSSPWLTSTSHSVWWFAGSESTESVDAGADSCELVAVRIERPTSNSRRVFGEITVPVPLFDVWAILTDYDKLSVHVPNLVESKIIRKPASGEQGDGSFSCRLFQRGAQKIVGFEFGASVTMDMQEKMASSTSMLPSVGSSPKASATRQDANGVSHVKNERKIIFKCVESMFFSEFDGEWVAKEQLGTSGKLETLLSYVVTVRPNGPVPVGALEWRIREDVPTNLRAVKAAAMNVGYEGVMASRQPGRINVRASGTKTRAALDRLTANVRSSVQWDTTETMAAYLNE